MKFKLYHKAFITALLILSCCTISFAQQNKEDKKQEKYTEVRNLVNSKKYVFVVQTVLPLRGRAINPTSSFDLTVSGDTLVSDLPYFGRAYVAPIDPSEGGFHFTSTNFDYTVKERKKDGWDIEISPKDAKDVRQMLLTVTESGYGSLQVISNNRQQISYNGYIKEIKGKR
ncbi:DUF4251 domain-containing protein [Segetibacter koreensis]|uniref:DUF4251 domain-containing protein n=1 Tax=Segetibacter koreensis TaxID=398037 RepID=UPI00036F61FB|nr:DUF4251 domain-containing protein [Segetibacter koreensis]